MKLYTVIAQKAENGEMWKLTPLRRNNHGLRTLVSEIGGDLDIARLLPIIAFIQY